MYLSFNFYIQNGYLLQYKRAWINSKVKYCSERSTINSSRDAKLTIGLILREKYAKIIFLRWLQAQILSFDK